MKNQEWSDLNSEQSHDPQRMRAMKKLTVLVIYLNFFPKRKLRSFLEKRKFVLNSQIICPVATQVATLSASQVMSAKPCTQTNKKLPPLNFETANKVVTALGCHLHVTLTLFSRCTSTDLNGTM